MGRGSGAADLHALITTTRSHFLSFQKEFLLVLESLIDIACAFLEKKKGTYRHEGLLSVLQQAHGLLGALIQRLAGLEGDDRADELRKILMKETSRMRKKGPLSKDNAYRQAALEAVINVINKRMKPAHSTATPRGGRAGETTSGPLKKVTIR